jgi:hypothetical protein
MSQSFLLQGHEPEQREVAGAYHEHGTRDHEGKQVLGK